MVHERSYANPYVLLPPVASNRISQISYIGQATNFVSSLLCFLDDNIVFLCKFFHVYL